MKIAIDAKRIMQNRSGLGSYGRNLITGFQQLNLDDEITLFAPKKSNFYDVNFSRNKRISTSYFKGKNRSYWRSFGIKNDLLAQKINIFHGISNEIPFSLKNTTIKSIVDIHDLLFLHFPKYYPYIDRKIYQAKTKYACKNADKIIATSKTVKQDIINFYGINEDKIKIVYQCCSDSFFQECPSEKKQFIVNKYKLPQEFILCVGSIESRKNQKSIVEAISISKSKLPLMLIGGGDINYRKQVIEEAHKRKVELILPDKFVPNEDLPIIYQLAKIMIYPSLAEGFGIPVLEAMASKTAVISSKGTSMEEIIQDEEALINPKDTEEMANKIDEFLSSSLTQRINENYQRANELTAKKFAQNVFKVYNEFR